MASVLDGLLTDIDTAKNITPRAEGVFASADLGQLDIGEFAGHPSIYWVELIGVSPFDVVMQFQRAKMDKALALPRLPKATLENPESHVMYVGSCQRNVGTRLRQHLQRTPVRTYALKLEAWFSGDVRFHVRFFELDQLTPRARFLLEDAIAHELRPLFGKRGTVG